MVIEHDQWAEIIEDLLEEIAQRIDSFFDYIRFRATCKNWYAKLPSSKYFNYPLLLLPSDHKSNSLHPIFHPKNKGVIHYLSLPETNNTTFRGSCYEWLIIVGLNDTIQMFNPYTRAQIHLPPISTLPNVISYKPERHDKEYTLRDSDGFTYTYEKWYMQRAMFNKVILSCPPDDENQDFMAVAIAIIGDNTNLCYCRRGDKKWTQLTHYSRTTFEDVLFHEGKIYVVDTGGFIYEFDMKTTLGGLNREPSFDNNVRTYMDEHIYLVQSSGGLLLVLRRGKLITNEGDMENEELRTYGFNVFRLDKSQNKWLEVKTLNDYVLVLGYNSSVCVMPHTFSRNKGNCIYYSDDWLEFQFYEGNEGYDVRASGYDNGIFDFEDGIIYTFFPDPNLICPAPIWLL